MRKFVLCLVVAILLPTCSLHLKSPALGQIKEGLTCLEYQDGMDWGIIAQHFGKPDMTPIPEAGTDLSQNVRAYENMVVIFHTKRQEVKEEGKVRFKEVVDKVEIGKRK
jgi:hypothetical protein